jgi:outer membrane protein assembly factor BamC
MPWHKTAAALAVIAMPVVLGACSSFELPTKKIDYKSSTTSTKLPPLEVPPDLARPATDDRFRIPDGNSKGSATFSDYNRERAGKPRVSSASATVLPKIDNATIERAGTQRWLVIQGTPEQAWPVIKEFWQENGFVVNVETPEAGVMETDWAENRAKVPESGIRGILGRALNNLYSTSERDKFRTRLERGVQPGTTEIYISHRGMEEVYITENQDQLRWQPRKPDPDLEAEMLRRMMVRFGVDDERARTQVAAAKLEPQARLDRSAGGSLLALNDQFDRAWRRVGLALDRVGFTVEDRDRSKGLYFVRYIDPDADLKTTEEKGWLSKLKFWSSGPKTVSKEQYRILVQGATGGAEVRVLDKDGTREQSDTANRILTLLYDQLK